MKKAFTVLGMIVGICFVVLGYKILSMEVRYEYITVPSYVTKFGADFYTEIYQVTHAAGGNTGKLIQTTADTAAIVKDGFAYLLMALGATDFCAFGIALSNGKSKRNDLNS
jgi:hypothetical protein